MKPKKTASSRRPAGPTRRAESTGERQRADAAARTVGPGRGKVASAPCTDRPATITGSAADFLPPNPTIPRMRAAANHCRGCALYLCGTHAVFGDGPRAARVMVVGEQPGDVEDKQGRVFVGPAGKLLDKVFTEVGIQRSELYLTNAVKHFKWARAATNKKRIHKSPSAREVKACFPWLEAEIRLIQPEIIVCLGAIAAKALLGNAFRVMKSRGMRVKSAWAPVVIATVHPSAVLRAPSDQRAAARAAFVSDLRKVAAALRPSRETITGTAAGRSRAYRPAPPSPTPRWRGAKRRRQRTTSPAGSRPA